MTATRRRCFPEPTWARPRASSPRRALYRPTPRVSLTIRAINECGAVYLIVAGSEKADRLVEVASQIERGDPTSPTAFVQPASRRLIWIVDRPASSRLKGHLHG